MSLKQLLYLLSKTNESALLQPSQRFIQTSIANSTTVVIFFYRRPWSILCSLISLFRWAESNCVLSMWIHLLPKWPPYPQTWLGGMIFSPVSLCKKWCEHKMLTIFLYYWFYLFFGSEIQLAWQLKLAGQGQTVKDEASCKQRGFWGFVCLSSGLLCQLKYHQKKNMEHSLRSNGMGWGGTFEQWSNKSKPTKAILSGLHSMSAFHKMSMQAD